MKTHGTKNSVATSRRTSPPITARPKGRILLAALAQAERHGDHADDHGSGGHDHRADADITCLDRGFERAFPSCNCSRAKDTIKMLLDVATPMAMMVPVRRWDAQRGSRHQQHPKDSGQGGGQGRDDDERIEPRLEVHDDQ